MIKNNRNRQGEKLLPKPEDKLVTGEHHQETTV